MLFFQLPVHASQAVTLTWNPSLATNVAGYKIYSGTTSLGYSNAVVVGNATNATLTGLMPGNTYYFAATTYDGLGNESDYSSEATYTVPMTPATLTLAAAGGGQFSFMVTGEAGSQQVVQASVNLIDWVTVQTNVAPFIFVDTNAASFCKRFYRTYAVTP